MEELECDLRTTHQAVMGNQTLPVSDQKLTDCLTHELITHKSERATQGTHSRDQLLLTLTILQNILLKRDNYKKLCAFMFKDNTLWEYLCVKLSSDDMFVSYSATKALSLAIITSSQDVGHCSDRQNMPGPVTVPMLALFNYLDHVTAERIQRHNVSAILDVLCLVFSKKLISDETASKPLLDGTQNFIRHKLCQYWPRLLNMILQKHDTQLPHKNIVNHENSINSLLKLWVRIIKHYHGESRVPNDVIDEGCDREYLIKAKRLLDRSFLATKTPHTYYKALKVVAVALPYNKTCSCATAISPVYSELGWYVVEGVRMNTIPRTVGDANFGIAELVVGFGGRQNADNVPVGKVDTRATRLTVLLVCRACAVCAKDLLHKPDNGQSRGVRDLYKLLHDVSDFMHENARYRDESSGIMELFGDQDDKLMEVMLCLLDTVLYCNKRILIAGESGDLPEHFEPHVMFVSFLQHVSLDPSVLLDFLTSPETCFLSYLVRYLKYLVQDWLAFYTTCERFSSNRCRDRELSRDMDHVTYTSAWKETVSRSHCELATTGDNVHQVSLLRNSLGNDREKCSDCCNEAKTRLTAGHLLEGCRFRLIDYSDSESSSDTETIDITDADGVGMTSRCHCESNSNNKSIATTESSLETRNDGSGVDRNEFSDEENRRRVCPLLDDIMSVLIRLRFAIEKLYQRNLFPYNVTPLLRLLRTCEALYET